VVFHPIPVNFDAEARARRKMLTAVGVHAKRIALETETKCGVMRFEKTREPGRASDLEISDI
jgi:hypothetical protein